MLALKKLHVRQIPTRGAAQDEPRRTSIAAPVSYKSARAFLFVGGYTLGEAYGTADYGAVVQRTCDAVMYTGLVPTLGIGHR